MTPPSTVIDIGTKSTNFNYSDTKNTTNTGNGYAARSPNDVLYKFTLTVPMEITATHCGSELNDTYMTLLDASKNVITYVDDYSGEGKCLNTYHSVIKRQLTTGTYYIVSEGYSGSGNITTTITGSINVPVTGVSLNQTSLSLTAINQTAQLTATVTPSNATNKIVTWSSSNTSVATVSATGLVTAKTEGTATITATTADANRTATCAAIVTFPIVLYEKKLPITVNPSSNQNYIKTRVYTSENDVLYYMDAVQYYDGLGRPSQAVQVGITPSQYDLVALQEYDNFGRESNIWLPAVVSGNNGAFVTGNLQSMSRSANSDQNPFAYPVYEPSPLNRVSEQYGPGQNWHAGGKSVKTEYPANSGSYPCAYYYMDGNNLKRNNNYGDGQLYVIKATDEEGNVSYEFRDKLGRVVLQRQTDAGDPHDTHYVYDDFGNLRFVLPPLAADATGGGSYTGDEPAIKNYAYVYKYDHRNRCIWKRLPGCEPIYYVYDKADRLIFSQDGEQRTNGNRWMFTLYDALGRPVVSGTCTNSIDYIGNPIRDMVVTASISTNSELKGYTCSYQINSPAVLTVNYYDNYDFRTFIPEISFDIGAGTEFNKQYTGGYKGLLTGTLTAVLDVNTTPGAYLYSVFFYDYRGQVIQTVSSNHLGGTEKEYITYTFTGQPEKRKHVHTAPGKSTQTETYGYDYDHAERLARTRYTLNSGPEILMSQNTYDELGRLKTTTPYRLGNFKSTYTYTVRSWISQINSNLYLEDLTYKFNGNVETMQWIQGGTTRKYTFGYDGLSRLKTADYDIPGSERLFVLDLDLFSASYGYDKHGNMTNLTRYGLKAPGNYDLIDNLTLNYGGSNQLKYVNDAGHEVLLSTSYDFKNYSSGADEYAYNANGSMTKDLNKGITSILYNAIGLPMHINIQNPVVRARNNYTYSADGKKLHVYYEVNGTYLSAPISGSSSLRVTQPIESWKNADYCGNILYEDDALKGILTENGYYDGENYYFYIRNHLGSNVITATKDGNIVQHTHYYPFGLTMGISTNQGVQPYKYTGKELDMEHGLMQYDFEARTYDPAVGRFLSIDPLCEKYYWISPYAYCVNNPVKFIDPDGRDIILRNVFRTNDRGNYDARKGKVSGKTQSALSDLMKTTEVKNFFAQFAKKGDKIGDYTFTENGTLSNKTLELNDYSFEEGYNSNLPLSREGSIGVDKDKGMVKVEIFSYGESKEDIGEIITHETQLHGYNVKDKLEGKSTMSGDKDHAALKSKNASHRGYKKYDSTRQQLKKIDSNYEKSFKEAERHAKEHY